ncbi:MAG: signal peptide peptidase SppA [Bacteroidaceae bacterium]|nr:signal peptide peptidase SppA [Bacteroidaceae bacterium]
MTFFKSVLASFTGILLFIAAIMLLSLLSLMGAAISESISKNVPDNSVYIINLQGTLTEQSEEAPLNMILKNDTKSISLETLLSNINKAKDCNEIKGIYIDCGMYFDPDSYASLEAIRKALTDFKKSGKWIVAYADVYSTPAYYIASVADKVLINEEGQLDLHGLASNPMFFKDALAKFGVKFMVSKVGKYKSAPEQFTADGMSEPNREQITAYIQGTWDNVVKGIAESRKISPEKVNEYADSLIAFKQAKDYLTYKLVDKVVKTWEVKDIVKDMLKIGKDDFLYTINDSDMEKCCKDSSDGDEIAVYYAYGDIVDTATEDFTTGHEIVGEDVCKDIIALADDDNVKAVVIRVNSGGGSASASEKMWQAIKKLKAKKPVVVSMGGMAASGGYYMSSIADWIVAENTTITGSIGIFGMFPDISQLLTEKLGVKFDLVKTNLHSDFGTRSRPISDSEMAILNKYIDHGYNQFLSRVSEGRKMKKERVAELAQGRVWLGQDAFKNKLVDEIGGLDKAVAKAAKLAKLDAHHTVSYPEQEDFMTQLLSQTPEKSIIEEELQAALGEYYKPFMYLKSINRQNCIQARIPFSIEMK